MQRKGWLYRVTLAQILRDAGKNPEEIKALVGEAFKNVPKEARELVRKEFPQ